jgi:hypothetical protein
MGRFRSNESKTQEISDMKMVTAAVECGEKNSGAPSRASVPDHAIPVLLLRSQNMRGDCEQYGKRRRYHNVRGWRHGLLRGVSLLEFPGEFRSVIAWTSW